MVALLLVFMILAALGFVISLAAHLIALTGRMPPGGDAIFAMHTGIVVVWLPAVLVSIRVGYAQGSRSLWSGWGRWRQALGGCPPWMIYAAYGLIGYALLNFVLAFASVGERLPNTGLESQTLRAFSGHWMLFYGLGFAILYSAFREPWRLKSMKCPSGHRVAHSDKFCPSCGVTLPTPSGRA